MKLYDNYARCRTYEECKDLIDMLYDEFPFPPITFMEVYEDEVGNVIMPVEIDDNFYEVIVSEPYQTIKDFIPWFVNWYITRTLTMHFPEIEAI